MQDSKISDWLQIIASLSVFVGLLLVAVEIRESNRVATSESVAELNHAWIEIQLVGAESDLFEVLAKSYEDPYGLSTEEMMRLESWFEAQISQYEWWLRAYELGTAQFDPRPIFADNAEFYFGSPFGRAYFEFARTWVRPDLIDAADAALTGRPLSQAQPSIAIIRKIMQQQRDQDSEK